MNLWDKTKNIFNNQQKGVWGRSSRSTTEIDDCDAPNYEIDLYEIYRESRTKKTISMFLPTPVQQTTFQKMDQPVDYLTTQDGFEQFLMENRSQHIFQKLLKEVIKEGSSCLYALRSGSKWRIRTTTDYRFSTEDVPRFIYVAAKKELTITFRDGHHHQGAPLYYKFDMEEGGAELVAHIDGEYKEINATASELKSQLGTEQTKYDQAAFAPFKINEDATSLFKPIQGKSDMLDCMASSLYKETEATTTGFILDSKKFANGPEGVKEFMHQQKMWKKTLAKFVYGTGANQFQQPVDMWNPNPRMENIQKAIETEMHAMDESIQMYRTIGSDGKSNNKGNVQEKQYNTPSYNLIFSILKHLDNSLNEWYNWINPNEKLTFGLSLPLKNEIENIFVKVEVQPQGGNNEPTGSTTSN